MKYSRSLTISHPTALEKPECLKNFNALNIEEGFNGLVDLFDDSVIVLDLDCVELKNAMRERRNQNSSMDCVFAIHNEETGKSEMLLVELRYNYINMQNLTRKKLIDKDTFSRIVLGNSRFINSESIFIFHKDLKEQAKSRLFRMLPRVPSEYIVMDIYELKTQYFD